MTKFAALILISTFTLVAQNLTAQKVQPSAPRVYFSDTSRKGIPFAKDPSVIRYSGKYFLYYSIPPLERPAADRDGEQSGWGIGIAESTDLIHWSKVGELSQLQPIERKGIAAPGARVIGNKVHLFYQTYGWGSSDAICHAISNDGIHFTHDPSNPVFRPQASRWSVGRAIDAEVIPVPEEGKAYLYFATRDPEMKRQMIGLAQADLKSNLGAGTWHEVSTGGPLIEPQLPWEQDCIEAPTVARHGRYFYMFYAGAYNNMPQQIGVAISGDGVHWKRVSDKPFLANGAPGSWNSSESGHPGVLQDADKTYLFYQGNNNQGRTYFLSMIPILWHGDTPSPDLTWDSERRDSVK